ncbi:hypothetical protein BH10BAC5_BH10BAC5_03680 [soil metagenome]
MVTIYGVYGRNVFALETKDNNLFTGMDEGDLVSTNTGANWTQTSLNIHKVLSIISYASNLFVSTLYSGICFSTNNGVSWTQSSLNNN